MKKMIVASFYYFFPIDEKDLGARKTDLESWADEFGVRGLAILATEGINCTLSGPQQGVVSFHTRVESWTKSAGRTQTVAPKFSPTERHTFRRFLVKIRPEIVTTSSPDLSPLTHSPQRNTHLSPDEWHELLTADEKDFLLVDTRNWYETKIGTFKGAVDPKISEFTEFTDFFLSQKVPKDKKVLIYCTGGIRCEKGLLELEKAGYQNVYQLEGGILNYLEKYPEGAFEGECFVFDHRVAVQPTLEPSAIYRLCPHCGQPAQESVTCVRCDHSTKICSECANKKAVQSQTCSKHCANQWTARPGRKGARQVPTHQRHQAQALSEN